MSWMPSGNDEFEYAIIDGDSVSMLTFDDVLEIITEHPDVEGFSLKLRDDEKPEVPKEVNCKTCANKGHDRPCYECGDIIDGKYRPTFREWIQK